MTLRSDLRAMADLGGVALSAALDRAGRLHGVGGAYEKALAARSQRSLPRIHTLVFAQEQLAEIQRKCPDLLRDDPCAEFHVLFAETLAEAVSKLTVDGQTRWGQIVDYRPELERHGELVGRVWLRRRVEAFLDGPGGGYLLLTAAPGFGKSALVAEMVRTSPEPPAFHFIKRGQGDWDRPRVILASLTAQLRRLYARRVLPGEERHSPAGAFAQVLARLSRTLAPGQRAVIYIDGLDEGFGGGGRYADRPITSILPRQLPPGVKIVLTSRPGSHLRWLADPSVCTTLRLDPHEDANQDDIRQYVRRQDRARNLGFDAAMIERLVDASDGCFAVAVLLLRETAARKATAEAWQRDPSVIPRGLDGWLEVQWSRLVDRPLTAAGRRGTRGPSAALTETVLGLLATAREPLSADQLTTFLSALVARERRGPRRRRAGGTGGVGQLCGQVGAVLDMTEEFFDQPDGDCSSASPRRFFHAAIPAFILNRLTATRRRECHRLLARACDRWRDYPQAEHGYALRYRLAHWTAARRWRRVAAGFADTEFIAERSRESGFEAVYADARVVAARRDLPPRWRGAFAQWEAFLRQRLERLRACPDAYAQEVLNEFLPQAAGEWTVALKDLAAGSPAGNGLRLHKLAGPPALDAGRHDGAVTCVVFSPCGRRLAAGNRDGTASVWDPRSGRLWCECVGHRDRVTGAVFSPDGRRLATASDDGTVKLWEPRTGRLLAECARHDSAVMGLSFSADGRQVLSASRDASVWVWDQGTGRRRPCRIGSLEDAGCVAVFAGADRWLLAAGDSSGTVRLWDVRMGRLQAEHLGHRDAVLRVAFSADGSCLASASKDGIVNLWDQIGGRLAADGAGHQGWVLGPCFSPDGRYLASAGADRSVKVWDRKTGRLAADCRGHLDEVRGLAFSADGRHLASAGGDGTVMVWEPATGRRLAECVGHREQVSCVAFPPRRPTGLLASGAWDGTIRLWDAAGGELVAECSGRPSGRRRRRPARSDCGRTRPRVHAQADVDPVVPFPLIGGPGSGHVRLAFSSSGDRVAVARGDGALTVWDVAAGRPLAECCGHRTAITALAFSPRGRYLASTAIDGTIRIWRASTGRLLAACVAGREPVTCMAFCRKGLLSGGVGGVLRLWAVPSGRLVASCRGHRQGIVSVAIPADGRWLASAGWDRNVIVWEAAGLRPRADCGKHGDCCTAVAFARDGCRLASAGSDGTVKVWETGTGRLLMRAAGHTAGVNCIAFTPDGRYLASAGGDRTVRLWPLAAQTGPAACRTSTLFFQHEPVALAAVAGRPGRLLVGDAVGQVFAYRIQCA